MELDDQQLIDAAYDLGRQLSIALENVQLLDEVLQQRRLLEDTFNSLIDLVVVTDNAPARRADERSVRGPRRQPARRPARSPARRAHRRGDGPVGGRPRAGRPETRRTVPPGGFPTTARTKQFTDERLEGVFAVTVTPLMNEDDERTGFVIVARDITVQSRLEAEREALWGTAGAVGEACRARSVRRRHRARDEQSAPGDHPGDPPAVDRSL